MDIKIKDRHISISVSFEQIQEAFKAICEDAHTNADGNAEDLILLSYHQCSDDIKTNNARSLLTTIVMATEEACLKSDIPFNLQDEYNAYLQQRQVEQDINRPPYVITFLFFAFRLKDR